MRKAVIYHILRAIVIAIILNYFLNALLPLINQDECYIKQNTRSIGQGEYDYYYGEDYGYDEDYDE